MRVFIGAQGGKANPREYVEIEKAVLRSLEKTHAEGAHECLREEVGNIRKAVAVLAAALADSGHISPNQLSELLHWPYEVEASATELAQEEAESRS